ncbi:unnamed protein product [Closterium sp. Yama58-4]|nr:unnamed protein product [Closterium sp. Yama58-4]
MEGVALIYNDGENEGPPSFLPPPVASSCCYLPTLPNLCVYLARCDLQEGEEDEGGRGSGGRGSGGSWEGEEEEEQEEEKEDEDWEDSEETRDGGRRRGGRGGGRGQGVEGRGIRGTRGGGGGRGGRGGGRGRGRGGGRGGAKRPLEALARANLPNLIFAKIPGAFAFTPGPSRALQAQQEVVLRVEVLQQEKRQLKGQEFLVLGSQPLTALRDRIYCLHDRIAREHGKSVPSGCFCIEDVFYDDMRQSGAVRYSAVILKWNREKRAAWSMLDERERRRNTPLARLPLPAPVRGLALGGLGTTGSMGTDYTFQEDGKGFGQQQQHEQPHQHHYQQQRVRLSLGDAPPPEYSAARMETTRFRDLTVRPGALYVYMHQGACKHAFRIADIRLLHPLDPLNAAEYPLLSHEPRCYLRRCSVCDVNPSTRVSLVSGDIAACESPSKQGTRPARFIVPVQASHSPLAGSSNDRIRESHAATQSTSARQTSIIATPEWQPMISTEVDQPLQSSALRPVSRPPSRGSALERPPSRGNASERPASHGNVSERKVVAKDPLLLRVARGEEAERTPVWLLRQSGRYLEDFRRLSEGYSFRDRLDNPELVTELSLLPWRKFATDAVVLFSDVLAVLPGVGLEFDMVRGRGAVVATPVRSREDLMRLRPLDDPDTQLPYLRPVLNALRRETAAAAAAAASSISSSRDSSGCDSSADRDGGAAVMGFVGAPWSVVAHAVEGQADQNLFLTKLMMMHDPELLHDILAFFEDALFALAVHQIDCGAQIIQVFDSWAHHLSPPQFAAFSLPYTNRLISRIHAARPHAPVLLQTIGSTGKLHLIAENCPANIVGLDWGCDMSEARRLFGEEVILQGNVDPMALLGPREYLREAVAECIKQGGGSRHVLNIGHGVVQDTPEEAVALFCQLAREESARFRAGSAAAEPTSRAQPSEAHVQSVGKDTDSTGRGNASQAASNDAIAAIHATWGVGDTAPKGVAAAAAFPSLSSALLASARHSLSSLSSPSRRRRYTSGC